MPSPIAVVGERLPTLLEHVTKSDVISFAKFPMQTPRVPSSR